MDHPATLIALVALDVFLVVGAARAVWRKFT